MSEEQTPEVPVRFYRSEAGREPVLDWRRGLDKKDRRTIGLDLVRVQFGWPLGSALTAAKPVYSPAYRVFSRPDARRAARVHQENAENTRG